MRVRQWNMPFTTILATCAITVLAVCFAHGGQYAETCQAQYAPFGCAQGLADGNPLSDCHNNDQTPCDEAVGVYCKSGAMIGKTCVLSFFDPEAHCDNQQSFPCGTKNRGACFHNSDGICTHDVNTEEETDEPCTVMECH